MTGPKVPTIPPFSYRGGRPSPVGKKNKVDHRMIGNSPPLMLLSFQRKFHNFFVTALDAIGSSVSILRYWSSYKKGEDDEVRYLTGYPCSSDREGQLIVGGDSEVKGLRDEDQVLSISRACPPGMGRSETAWLERSRKCSGRCLGGSKT